MKGFFIGKAIGTIIALLFMGIYFLFKYGLRFFRDNKIGHRLFM